MISNAWNIVAGHVYAHYFTGLNGSGESSCGVTVNGTDARPWTVAHDIGKVPLCPGCMHVIRADTHGYFEDLDDTGEDTP